MINIWKNRSSVLIWVGWSDPKEASYFRELTFSMIKLPRVADKWGAKKEKRNPWQPVAGQLSVGNEPSICRNRQGAFLLSRTLVLKLVNNWCKSNVHLRLYEIFPLRHRTKKFTKDSFFWAIFYAKVTCLPGRRNPKVRVAHGVYWIRLPLTRESATWSALLVRLTMLVQVVRQRKAS